MPEVTTEQFILEICKQLDAKLSAEDKALLLGLGVGGLSREDIAWKVLPVAKSLTNEEVILLLRIKYQGKQAEEELMFIKRRESLIRSLLDGNLSEDYQCQVRADLMFNHLIPRTAIHKKTNAKA